MRKKLIFLITLASILSGNTITLDKLCEISSQVQDGDTYEVTVDDKIHKVTFIKNEWYINKEIMLKPCTHLNITKLFEDTSSWVKIN